MLLTVQWYVNQWIAANSSAIEEKGHAEHLVTIGEAMAYILPRINVDEVTLRRILTMCKDDLLYQVSFVCK